MAHLQLSTQHATSYMKPGEISIIAGHSKNSITVQAHRGLIKLRFLYNQKLR